MNLVRELPGLLVVDGVGVQQGAERLEVGLLLQQRDKVVSVARESGGYDSPDLALDVIRLQKNQKTIKKTKHVTRASIFRLIKIQNICTEDLNLQQTYQREHLENKKKNPQ